MKNFTTSFLTTYFRLAGVTYEIIKDLSADIKAQYSGIARSILLSTGLAFWGGFDVAHQYTSSTPINVAVGLIWATMIFIFDFNLVNGGKVSNLTKYVRVAIGFANILITTTALLVFLNQATIDSTIRVQNAAKIAELNNQYLAEKESRYKSYDRKKAEIDTYHANTCEPEAKIGFAGKTYDKKHAHCITIGSVLNQEVSQLDSAEVGYYKSYIDSKVALESIETNDFFIKSKMLFEIVWANKVVLVLVIALFLFLSYMELQGISLKFAIDGNDEYHKGKARYEELKEAEREAIHLRRRVLLEAENEQIRKILIEKGYTKSVAYMDSMNVSISSPQLDKSKTDAIDIFKTTKPMLEVVDEIIKTTDDDNRVKAVFDWVTSNIEYDTNHTKHHYRTAADTFNNRIGVCGEQSVIIMSLLRAMGKTSAFVEVTVDCNSKEVSHACVCINRGTDRQQLIDATYKDFDAKHIKWRIVEDAELTTNYKGWNR